MGFNSSDWGALAGAAASAYSPQAGATVQSLFGSKPQPAPSQAIAAPVPVTEKVPGYVWIVGGIGASLLVVFILVRLTK